MTVEVSPRQAATLPLFERAVFVGRFYPYPEHAGAFLYSSQMMKLWAKLAKRLDVFCAIQPGTTPDLSVAEAADGTNFHFGSVRAAGLVSLLFSLEPKSALEFAHAENAEKLRRILESRSPDVIVVEHLGATWALPVIESYRRKQARPPRLVYSTQNEETTTRLTIAREAGLLRGLYFRVDAWRILRRERQILAAADLLTCICESDLRAYERIADGPGVVLLPTYNGPILAMRAITAETPRKVVIVSSFYWSAKLLNLEVFLGDVLEDFTAANIQVDIVGRMRPHDLARLRARFPSAHFHGGVDHVEPYLQDARIGLIIDQAGGGFKMSVLTYAFSRAPMAMLEAALNDVRWRDSMIVADSRCDLANRVIAAIDDLGALNAMQEGMFQHLQGALTDAENVAAMAAALGSTPKDTGGGNQP